jgi:uncharacterized repeat protein (TIGR03803 family)
MRASDGDLYGTLSSGEVDEGTLFHIAAADGSVSLVHYGSSVGTHPCGRLLEPMGGLSFVGTASIGPGAGAGTIFQVDAEGTASIVHDFSGDGSGAAMPCSDLTLGADGAYYVTTLSSQDPSPTPGGIFRVTPAGVETLGRFFGPNGAAPYAGVTETPAGAFYGTTVGGGALSGGTLFRIGAGGQFDSVLSFDATVMGSQPMGTMLLATDGYLYGTTTYGGWWAGTVFRFSAGTPLVTVGPASGPASGGTAVTITGTNFEPDGAVSFGGTPGVNPKIAGSTSATATTPALPPGTLNHVVVLNPDRSSGTVIEGWLADFLDVPQGDPFHAYVEQVVRQHAAAGFGDGNFGRDVSVTRAQMAVLLLKAKHGSAFVPPGCTGIFGDVQCGSLFADWIEQLAAEGISAGCGGGNYCPDAAVRRDQMSAFLLKAEHGSSYVPPPCTGQFGDVACPSLFADWIERLAAENVTAGCGGGNYCPLNPNTRGQMAVFLTRVFFPLP